MTHGSTPTDSLRFLTVHTAGLDRDGRAELQLKTNSQEYYFQPSQIDDTRKEFIRERVNNI